MSKEPNNIDQLVREKLDGFEMTPPPSVWKNTSAALGAGRKKRFFLWFFFGFVLIAGTGTGIYLMNDQTLKKTESAQQASNIKMNDSTEILKKLGRGHGRDIDLLNKESTSTPTANGTRSSSIDPKTPNSKGPEKSATSFPGKRNQVSPDNSQNKTALNDDGFAATNDTDNSADANNPSDKNDKLSSSKKPIDDPVNNPLMTPTSNFLHTKGLPFKGIELFSIARPEPVRNHFDEDSLPLPIPFWKSLSVEGAFGISTFNIQASKKTTEPSLLEVLNNAASKQLSLDFRFGVNYHFGQQWSFQTGLEYSSSQEDYTYEIPETTTTYVMDTVSFTVDTASMDTTYIINVTSLEEQSFVQKTESNTYKLFTLPFQFAWTRSLGKRSSLEIGVGGAITLFGTNSGLVRYDQYDTLMASAASAYHTSGMLSVGGSLKYMYRFSEHHSVYVEPWTRFGVTNQSTPNLQYETFRKNYGIRFGYRFYF